MYSTSLSEFEQVIYANHYDLNDVEGSPRLGWVKIGLVGGFLNADS